MLHARRCLPLLVIAALAMAAPARADRSHRHGPVAAPIRAAAPAVPAVDCGPVAITQNASQTPENFSSIACIQNVTDYHLDNSWYRAFRLPDSAIQGQYLVCSVDLAIEQAQSGGGTGQSMTVNLYAIQEGCAFPADFPSLAAQLIGTTTINVVDQSLTNITVPVAGNAPAGSQLVVEVHVPDGVATQDIFFLGSNSQAQTGPTYVYSAGCGDPGPIDLAEFDPTSHVIMTVHGSVDPLVPPAVRVDEAAGNLVIEPGETVEIAPSWQNISGGDITLTGTLSNLVAPAGFVGAIPDSTADYGVITAGATSNCADATQDCYSVQLTGAGFGHRDATVDETLVAGTPTVAVGPSPRTRTLHIGASFADVPSSNIFYRFVETLLHNGVTGGCATANSYCPGDGTLRKQMAVFLLKALDGHCFVPPSATGVFNDVPASDPFAPWIEELASRGITGGCAPNAFCPDGIVKRKQMAVFLLKTLLGSGYTPPAATGIFDDVPVDAFQPFIEDLYNRGITGGCAGGPPPLPISFCPENPVTRGQMSAFLSKTLTLVLYRP